MNVLKMITIFYIGAKLMIYSPNVYAFDKVKNGFTTITTTYLNPILGAVAGAALITFIILSFFKQEEYQKKVASVFSLSVIGAVGTDILEKVITSFS